MKPETPAPWSPLDNTGKLFPSIQNHRYTGFFRISVTLKDPIRRGVLQDALDLIMPRFNFFQVRMSPGLFWYTLVEDLPLPRIWPDSNNPCIRFKRPFRDPHLFRIRYYDKRIALEISHALTDGFGALEFLKTLVWAYLEERKNQPLDSQGILTPGQPSDPRETEDAFLGIYQKGLPKVTPRSQAFQIPFPRLGAGNYRIITGEVPTDKLKALAQTQGCSITEFLGATLLWSLQALKETLHQISKHEKPFRIMIPINLRKFFPSPTLRNFFTTIPLELDCRLGHYDFEEITKKVHHFMKAELDEKLIRQQIARNVEGERNPVVRVLPLFLKSFFLRGIFKRGEKLHTMSLSNLGVVEFPQAWSEEIQGLDFIPPPSPHNPVNLSVISFGNRLSLTFGRVLEDTRLEYFFFNHLRSLGLPVTISSNQESD